MKIGIVSDLHLGYSRWADDSYNQARRAILKASELCDIIIIPGDVFDKENPSIQTISEVIKILLELEEKEWGKGIVTYNDQNQPVKKRLPIAVIHGNHERIDKSKLNPVQFVNLTKFWIDVHNMPIIFEKDNEKVRVCGMGAVPEDLAKIVLNKMNAEPKQGMFNVLMLHQTFNEFVPIDKSDYLCYEDLPKGFELYVNGHIHKKIIDMDGKFIVPGSTVLTQLNKEEQESKGFIVYDTKNNTHEFIEIDSRPFIYKKLTFEDCEQTQVELKVNETVNEIIEQYSNPIIRIVLDGNLIKGLKPSDINFRKSYDNALLFIENQFEGYTIKSTINKIQMAKKENNDPKAMGMTLLREKLKQIEFEEDDIEQIFNAMADSADKGMEYIESLKKEHNKEENEEQGKQNKL